MSIEYNFSLNSHVPTSITSTVLQLSLEASNISDYIIIITFARIRPGGGGQKPTHPAFCPAFAVGVICFLVRVKPPQPAAIFFPYVENSLLVPFFVQLI